jgi:type II secretory pathway predicted ATPase ExeA
MVLIGQPELRKRLNRKHYEPLIQRVSIHYHLQALGFEETCSYVKHRIKVAGQESTLFSEDALKELFQYSEGIPRKINNIASNALLEGFGKEVRHIDRDIIFDVARDMYLV